MLIRMFDFVIALLGCCVLLLMLPVIALLIKFDSQGTVFYKCDRVGKKGTLFKMYKFRTMYETKKSLGASVSPEGDPRVTSVGKVLRRLKLNEFPQFINVLKGDMSVVGPRPESPDLAARYPAAARPIFSVKPGLVGPNQILGRNEEEFYPRGVDPQEYYLEEILPRKIPVDLQYIQEQSFFLNVKYLILGIWITMAGAIKRQHLTDNLSQIMMLAADSACCLLSFSLAFYLRNDTVMPLFTKPILREILPVTLLARVPLLMYLGCYQNLIRYLSIESLKQVFLGVTLGSGLLIFSGYFLGIPLTEYGRSVFVIDWLCLTILLISYRIFLKTFLNSRNTSATEPSAPAPCRALIWGAGDEGQWCLRYLRESMNPLYEVVGFIDGDPKMQNRRIEGFKVLGNHHHLDILAQLYHINEVIVAEPVSAPLQLEVIQEVCNKFSISLLKFMPRTTQKMCPGDGQLKSPLFSTQEQYS